MNSLLSELSASVYTFLLFPLCLRCMPSRVMIEVSARG